MGQNLCQGLAMTSEIDDTCMKIVSQVRDTRKAKPLTCSSLRYGQTTKLAQILHEHSTLFAITTSTRLLRTLHCQIGHHSKARVTEANHVCHKTTVATPAPLIIITRPHDLDTCQIAKSTKFLLQNLFIDFWCQVAYGPGATVSLL